jgi:cell division protein FtsI/penicillin-binding protein 2
MKKSNTSYMRSKTALILLLLIGVGFIGVAVRCFYLQYYKNSYYQQTSIRSQQSNFIEQPKRGAILDCRGRILAASYVADTIFVEPRAVGDIKAAAKELAGIIDLSATEISKTILTARNSGYAPIIADIRLTNEQRKRIQKIEGIGIESKWKRYYPMGNVAVHAVGFIGTDGKGMSGLELEYDKMLRGTFGGSTFFSDAARRPISLEKFGGSAQDGCDVVLSLDSTIQEIAHTALKKQIAEFQAESGVAMVMDPCSGAILAMVSLPDFDPVTLKGADEKSMGNHIICDPFEPGSIIKPVIASWALETGTIHPDDVIFCENGRYSGKGFGTIDEYHSGGFGNLPISGIISNSSNIGMAKIGQKMGAAKLYDGAKLFGFGRKTGVDLPGEDAGIVWPLKVWTGYSIARVAFGHEIETTSMQMACAFCTLANHGRPIRPHIVEAVVNNAGNKIKMEEPAQTAGYIISEKTARWIVETAMVKVVQEGTGKKAAIEGREVWGKTGTANIANKGRGGYDEQNYVSSFIGGSPAKEPKIIVLVSIRKPNKALAKGYTGGAVSAPAAKEILEQTLAYLNL